MDYTTNYGLRKPEPTDYYDVADANFNMDKIDQVLKDNESAIANHTAATTGVHGATSAATPNTIVQRDANGRFKAAAPSASDDVARKAEVDAALPKVRRAGTITGPITVTGLDLSQYDFVLVDTLNGDVTIDGILGNAPGHQCRLVKINSVGTLTVKHGGATNQNWAQDQKDIVLGPSDRYGFVEIQWNATGTGLYINAVMDNGKKYARLAEENTFTASQTIQTSQPVTRYRTTNDALNALTGPMYQNSAGENRWIVGYNPNLNIYGVYDYVRASLRFSIAADGPFTFDGRTLAVGSGSPEGVVTAPPGSLYLNTAGGSGTTFYVKRTGTGNTGWFAVA